MRTTVSQNFRKAKRVKIFQMLKKNRLLYNKSPLVVNTDLWQLVGLNESIIMQQVHYWTEKNREEGRNFEDGEYWTYNTYENWGKQFPGWHVDTIRKIIKRLEGRGLLVSGSFNKHWTDRTKWYRIDYCALERLEGDADVCLVSDKEQPDATPGSHPDATSESVGKCGFAGDFMKKMILVEEKKEKKVDINKVVRRIH
jgi:hypothetical protein